MIGDEQGIRSLFHSFKLPKQDLKETLGKLEKCRDMEIRFQYIIRRLTEIFALFGNLVFTRL